jgi:hypothetical protein
METAPDILILGPRTSNLGFYFTAEGGPPSRKLKNDSSHPYPFRGSPPLAPVGIRVWKSSN